MSRARSASHAGIPRDGGLADLLAEADAPLPSAYRAAATLNTSA